MCAAQDYKKPSQDPISKVVIHVVLFMSLLISNISFFCANVYCRYSMLDDLNMTIFCVKGSIHFRVISTSTRVNITLCVSYTLFTSLNSAWYFTIYILFHFHYERMIFVLSYIYAVILQISNKGFVFKIVWVWVQNHWKTGHLFFPAYIKSVNLLFLVSA